MSARRWKPRPDSAKATGRAESTPTPSFGVQRCAPDQWRQLPWRRCFRRPGAGQNPGPNAAYLVNSIVACGNCHTPKNPDAANRAMLLAGGMVIEAPPSPPSRPTSRRTRKTGIGAWSDFRSRAAIREGTRPDGSIIGPPMPTEFYAKISDHDVMAIVAYLRTVPPVCNKDRQVDLPECRCPRASNAAGDHDPPPANDKVAYGAYLAGPLGTAWECHTPMRADGGRDMARIGAGGLLIPVAGRSAPPNITPDKEIGIGA